MALRRTNDCLPFFLKSFKANKGEPLGAARPQTCARVVTTLDPQLAK